MNDVKSLVNKLVSVATNLGQQQYRLRSIEEIIKGFDARAGDMKRTFTDPDADDREFLRASLALQTRSRNISVRDARRIRHDITRARSRIESITAKLELLSGRP